MTPQNGGSNGEGQLELSVVMPCLNEADTLATCIEKILRATREAGIRAEVIVADNGSTDESADIASDLGARVVRVDEPGYGSALMGGIEAARGRYIIMGDADDSYDFLEIPKFVTKLREGYDLVQGCRLPRGGGTIMPGAMPFLHRWVGNPMLSAMVRTMFGVTVSDIYCGLRGFTKALYERLDLRCTGMEFATEMTIKAALTRTKVSEVPITLHPDGRTSHAPHLKTFRDGWRTVRFFLMTSPRWLFLIPGLVLILLGLVGYALVYSRASPFGVTPDAHTLLIASLAVLMGHQSILFAIHTKTFAVMERLLPPDPRLDRFFSIFRIEHGLITGAVGMLAGLVALVVATAHWHSQGFGPIDYSETMRWVIPGVTLTALGFQTVLGSFFVTILGMRRL